MTSNKSDQTQSEIYEDQADLFTDDIYEHNTEDNLPEDIKREFGIPDQHPIKLLDTPAAKIIEHATRPWERLREQASSGGFSYSDNPEKTGPLCETTIQTDLLKTVVHHLDAVLDEFKLVIREEGMYIVAVDSANIEMIEVWIDKADLTNYTVNQPNTVGMTVKTWQNILKHTKTDAIRFSLTQDTRKIVIEDGFTTKKGLIDPDAMRRTPSFPWNMGYPTKATLPGVDLKDVTYQAEEDDDTLGIRTTTDNSIVFGVPGSDRNECFDKVIKTYTNYKDLTEYRKRSISQYNFNINAAEETFSYYSTDYLKELFKTAKSNLRTDYHIRLGDNIPIRINREIGENSFINVTIAPQTKSD